MKIIVNILMLVVLFACSRAENTYQMQIENGVVVCDLVNFDTKKMLALADIGPSINSEHFFETFGNDNAKWIYSDINRSRCEREHEPNADRALRIFVPAELSPSGYQIIYDVYFGADGFLVIIEARHRFVDI